MKISQREARQLRKRVLVLENIIAQQNRSWVTEWPSNICIGLMGADAVTIARVQTARKLGHAVVVTVSGTDLALYAAKL